jgi:hypothetical protein
MSNLHRGHSIDESYQVSVVAMFQSRMKGEPLVWWKPCILFVYICIVVVVGDLIIKRDSINWFNPRHIFVPDGQQLQQYQQNEPPPLTSNQSLNTEIDHDICQWKSRFWLETGTKMCRGLNQLMESLLMIKSPTTLRDVNLIYEVICNRPSPINLVQGIP